MDYYVKNFIPHGQLETPSSKSYAHRFLIVAFMNNKPVTIKDIVFSDDIKTTINALKVMGAKFKVGKDYVKFIKRKTVKAPLIIKVNESATTLRLLIPLASYIFGRVKFVGSKTLFSRPLDIYEEILTDQHVKYEKGEDFIEIFENFPLINYEIKGDISSQFASGLILLAAYSKKAFKVNVIPPFESYNYFEMTLHVLDLFGYQINKNKYCFTYSHKIENELTDFDVETDFSLLANFAVLSALRGNVSFKVDNIFSVQGDVEIFNILKSIGAKIEYPDNSVSIKRAEILKPFQVDIKNIIDLGPILFVLAALIPGKSTIKNARRLKMKESDRLKSMITELSKIGVKAKLIRDTVYIEGQESYKIDQVTFETYNDHRIAMALTILGMFIDGQVTVKDINCVTKSYPNFIKDLESLNK